MTQQYIYLLIYVESTSLFHILICQINSKIWNYFHMCLQEWNCAKSYRWDSGYFTLKCCGVFIYTGYMFFKIHNFLWSRVNVLIDSAFDWLHRSKLTINNVAFIFTSRLYYKYLMWSKFKNKQSDLKCFKRTFIWIGCCCLFNEYNKFQIKSICNSFFARNLVYVLALSYITIYCPAGVLVCLGIRAP